jgi:hypothetical protein
VLRKNPIKMKKLIKHNGYNNLYIMQKESPDESNATVRVFLSASKFDMDVDYCLKKNIIEYVNKTEFDNMVRSMMSTVNEIYSSDRSAIMTETSNTVLIPECMDNEVRRMKVRSLFSEMTGGCSSVLDNPFHTVSKRYVLKRMAEEYSIITENKDPIYCVDGKGMYYIISSEDDYYKLCSFDDMDNHLDFGWKKDEYSVKVNKNNVDLLFDPIVKQNENRMMRKVLFHKSVKDIYIVEDESVNGNMLSLRPILSDMVFDMNVDENMICDTFEFVSESKFREYISRIIDIASKFVNSDNAILKNIGQGNIVVSSENGRHVNDIVSEMLGNESSEFNNENAYINIPIEYLLAKLAYEYKHVTGDFTPLYHLNGYGMYFMIDSDDTNVVLVPFSEYDDYIKSVVAESGCERYKITAKRSNVCQLSRNIFDHIDSKAIITKMKNGEGANTPSGEFKNDRLDDKLRWELLPMEEIEDVVKVFHYGAKKYAPDSWKNIPDGFERYRAALMRHMMSYLRGERIDPESGLQHLAQVTWNAIAMLYYDKHDMGKFPNIISNPNEGCIGSKERSKSFRKK